MPGKAAKQAVEWTEADRFRPVLGLWSIATMMLIVHRLGGPERSRVSCGEPPAFFEHDDLRRFREASQRDGSRSTIPFRAHNLLESPQIRDAYPDQAEHADQREVHAHLVRVECNQDDRRTSDDQCNDEHDSPRCSAVSWRVVWRHDSCFHVGRAADGRLRPGSVTEHPQTPATPPQLQDAGCLDRSVRKGTR
jgi:hypothetical protein